MPAPIGRSQQLTPGTLIDLFDINMTEIGGGVYHFTPGVLEAKACLERRYL